MGERVEEAIVGRKKNQSLKIVCVELEMCGGISWDDNSKCDRHNFSFLFFFFCLVTTNKIRLCVVQPHIFGQSISRFCIMFFL